MLGRKVEFDLFTFSAQIVNFIVLVVLLRIFLYKRIIDAMDKREERIASRLQEADKREASAREEEEQLKSKNRELDERREELLDEARGDAEKRREELIEQAEEEVREKKEEWLKAIEEDKNEMMSEIREITSESLLGVVRRIVGDLAGEELESQIVHTFLSRLSGATDEERGGLKGEILIRSSFPLDEDQREMIQKQIRDAFSGSASCTFETDDRMSFGIEASTENQKVSWTVDSYIDSLKEEMQNRLEREVEERSDV